MESGEENVGRYGEGAPAAGSDTPPFRESAAAGIDTRD